MPMISREGLNRRGSIIRSLIIINIAGDPHMYFLVIHADHLEISNNDSELTLHFHLLIPVSFFQTPHHYTIPINLRINQGQVHIEELGESSSGSNNGSDQDQVHIHTEELGESSGSSNVNDQDQSQGQGQGQGHIHIEELGEISTSSSDGAGDQGINGHLAYYVEFPPSPSDDDGSHHGHAHVGGHENGFQEP